MSCSGTHFVNDDIKEMTKNNKIKHHFTSPYHPRVDGQTEKTNRILCKIIT